MSTVPAVEIDGNDVTDELQDKSLSIKLNSVDLTLIDPAVMPAISDVLTVDTPAWTGTVNQVETVGYEGDVPFVKVRATNVAVLPDNGAGAFNLSDAGTAQSSPAGYRDLSVNEQLQGSTTEVRAKVTVFKEGLEAGDEIDLTSAVHGYTAETFTIMDLTTDYPVDSGARYTLDLGLGDYATATTGASGGGPLAPIRWGRSPSPSGPYWGPGSGGGGSGSGDASVVYLLKTGSGNFSAAAGGTAIDWPHIYSPYNGDDYGTTFPASMGLSLTTSNTYLECSSAGLFTFDCTFSGVDITKVGTVEIRHSLASGNPIQDFYVKFWWISLTQPMGAGDTIYFYQSNNSAASILDYAEVVITRHAGGWDGVR